MSLSRETPEKERIAELDKMENLTSWLCKVPRIFSNGELRERPRVATVPLKLAWMEHNSSTYYQWDLNKPCSLAEEM